MKTPDIDIGQLFEAQVQDESGKSLALGDLAQGKPTLIVFLRHFGCIACTEHVQDLKPHFDEFNMLGVQTILIGLGKPRFIPGFIERTGIEKFGLTVVTDPTLKIHELLNLKRSVFSAIGPRAVKNALRAFSKGMGQSSVEGDPLQQGGTLLLDGTGLVIHYHRDRSLGDHADPNDIVQQAFQIAKAAV